MESFSYMIDPYVYSLRLGNFKNFQKNCFKTLEYNIKIHIKKRKKSNNKHS